VHRLDDLAADELDDDRIVAVGTDARCHPSKSR
jgi:hypothetical protein